MRSVCKCRMGSSTVTGPFVASIDQGTTSSRFIIFDKNFSPVVTESIELSSVYRKPG